MKQTKPYGRAHLTAAERKLLAQPDTPAHQPPPPLASRVPDSQQDIFNLSGENLALPTAPPGDKNPSWLRLGSTYALVLVAALTVFVLVRDSMLLARLIEQMSSREAVMVCKEGKMHYPDYNPLDRLLGKGHFVCTEWSIQRGMLSIPRPFY